MRKLLLLAALLLCAIPAYGQVPQTGAGKGTPSTGGCGSAATNFLARNGNAHPTETTNLICGLVSDGIITGDLSGTAGCGTVLSNLYIFATDTTGHANLNLC